MLEKRPIDIAFGQGLDTKTDPKRVPIGKFVRLENSVFNKGGLLQKRTGYAKLPALPSSSYQHVTTFNGNLTAIGGDIAAYNKGGAEWVQRGTVQPLSLSTLTLVRNNLNQTACDTAIAPNGVICTVYLESDGSTTTNKFVLSDAVTGQNVRAPEAIPVSSGAVSGGMRVFVLGNNFIIVFTNTITAVAHLQYIAVSSVDPTNVTANTDIAAAYIPSTTVAWDGYVVGSRLYIAYNSTTGGQSIKVTYLTSSLVVASPVSFTNAAFKANMMSVTADESDASNPIIYFSFYRTDTDDAFTGAVNSGLFTVFSPTNTIAGALTISVLNITSSAQNGVCSVFVEVDDSGSSIGTYNITQAGSPSALSTVIRGMGLASKSFLIGETIGVMGIHSSPYQPTYFLVNGSTSTEDEPVIVARLAYQNGGGYLTTGLPSATVSGVEVSIPYRFKSLIQAVNKNTNVPSGSQTAGIYSQTGINIAKFDFDPTNLDTVEIGSNLQMSGGFLGMYDGYLPVESNFFLYPEPVAAVWSATGGSMAAQPDGATNTKAYFYQVTYEWTDNQGNAFRSAPSIPVSVTTTGSGTSGSVELTIATLRATMKVANPVKIVVYRWSVAQQVYYQTTSISSPILNDTTVDSIIFTDTNADATILGNNIIYTTGGVIENIGPPACDVFALFDTRLWLVDAENRNLLWFSKQVIQNVPVEMSDAFTLYVPPNTGTEENTGPIKTLCVMDDKLIIGKENAFVYINGAGPDNTGASNQYSPATFITSTVGCTNQKSMVVTPMGVMFQSNKGIWMISRDLQTNFIGAAVQELTQGATVLSALTIPSTNQVRFTLDTGITLMYDYYYDQWGTFVGIDAGSSCIYEDLHTVISSAGSIYQQTTNSYLDGTSPVLLSFKTGPLRLADLQSYQRAYFFYLLGEFISPHKLLVNIAFDYAQTPSQSLVISPTNYSTPFGSGASQSPFGQGSPFGGPSNLEDWRIMLDQQRCMAFDIEIQEMFDPTQGAVAGAGFNLSGLNVICGFKKGYRPQSAAHTAG